MKQYFHAESNMHFSPGQHFVLGNIQYPANWLDLATDNEIEALGLVPVVTVGARKDDGLHDVSDVLSGAILTITAIPKDISAVKSIHAAAISASRYALETAGITLPDGRRISTDRDSQALITGALLTVQRSPSLLIDWKGENGWTKIGKTEIESLADAVSNHVQACFSAERAKTEALAALTDFEALVAFDPTITL